uniref:Reverse transcriptase domain-containing protein n=1 Tax=Tanacetum cinerariifolium TaxID=118510 RepID=A0A6L2LT22_TANCI|nr:reverse transcriptase domain-containing protein [Tanacetum cinerariifolium]
MRTRSKSYPNNSNATIPRRQNRRRVPNIVEPEIRTIEKVVPMADRTMEELLQAPTEGYREAIIIPKILVENCEIKTNLLQLVQTNKFHGFERDNPHTHISNFKRMTSTLKYRDVPNDAIKLMLFSYSLEGAARIWYEKEPPNSILTFEKTFGEAWERFKKMLRACPHHGFLELTQIYTFYNGLNEQDQDSVNAATGRNLLSKTTREALKIIENKSKVCYSRSKSNVSRVNTNSRESSSKTDDRIDKLAEQISNLVEIINKQVITLASVKAVEKTCVICGGAHAYYDCIATDSNQSSVHAETAKVPLNENFSAMLLKKLPEKLGDPGKFLIPCDLQGIDVCHALADLVRSFLRTGIALIDIYGEEITLRVNDESVTFNLNQTMRYSSTYDDNSVNRVDVIDIAYEEYAQEVLDFKYNSKSENPTLVSNPSFFEETKSEFCKEPIVKSSSPTLTPFGESDFLLEEIEDFLKDESIPMGIEDSFYDPEGDILYLEKLLNDDPSQLPLMDLKQAEETKAKSSIEEPPELELKELRSYLEYAFLEETDKLPVIIAKDLKDDEKEALVKVLKSHKRAIAWKITDIKAHGKLNDATRKDHFSLPFMDQMLERLARNEFYCFLDGFSCYFQIPIDPQDQEKTTFTYPYGTFTYRRMSFGLCNALGTFQRCMIAIFHDMIEKTMEVFMDDLLVFEDNFSPCLSNLDKMLKRCEDTNLVLNWEKCHFMCKEGIVLGHKISKSGIEVNRAKVDVIAKLPHPTTIKGVRSFLSHAGFYRRFIQDFSKMARPMTHLLEKETPFVFFKDCIDAFKTLKKNLTEAPILVVLDWNLPFELICDASDFTNVNKIPSRGCSGGFSSCKNLISPFVIKKGSENLAADHLSRLENPHKDVLENKDMNEKFPLETLGSISSGSTPCDRETHFCNDQFAKVMTKYGVTHRLATAYHPQTSGQVEVSNQGLKRILERTVGENHASWSDRLDDAHWAFRTAFKTPIGCTPYKLVYGKSCHLPIELEHKAYWALKHANFDLKTTGDHQKLQLNKLNELRDKAYKNSLIYKERTKKLHVSKIKNRIFNVGDQVLLFNSRLKIFSGKLKTRCSGPFTITQFFLYGAVELSQPDGPNFKVNGHHVKHYFEGDIL